MACEDKSREETVVVEMRMLRGSMAKTRKDSIRNDFLREMAGAIEVSRKIQQRRL